MSGFTALTDQIGASKVVEILRIFYELVSTEVIGSGGYVDKYIGDAVMAVFGAGATTEEGYGHVLKAIHASRRVMSRSNAFRIDFVEPALKRKQERMVAKGVIGEFRVGLESGDVEIKRFDRGNESEVTFVGTPVNIASRLLSHAQAGELWLGFNARSSGSHADEIIKEQEIEYKNLPGKFTAYQVKI